MRLGPFGCTAICNKTLVSSLMQGKHLSVVDLIRERDVFSDLLINLSFLFSSRVDVKASRNPAFENAI